MGLYDLSFYDVIQRNALAFGPQLCWHEVDDGRTLTFAEYKMQVDSLAAGLARAGIRKGDRIGVIGKNSLEFFLIYGAAAYLGAIVLPVNWRLSGDEVRFNLDDCQPRIIFADAEFQPLLQSGSIESNVQGSYNLKSDSGSLVPFTELMQEAENVAPAEVESTDGFVIIHTAAVAGRPRGALLSHGNMLFADMHFQYYLQLGAEDVHLNLLPLFHVGGLFLATSAFHAGSANLNISKFEATAAANLIQKHKATLFFDFPPILDSILKAAEENQIDISSLKSVVGLGTPEVIEKFQSVTDGYYYVMYGQTETSCLASMGRYNDCPGSAGKAIPLGDVQLVNDHDQPVAPGETGEITLKGPMVFKGYWGLPEDNAYTFREGRHHTGDLGRFNEDGFLFYAGRKAEKELIKPGGENVYPAEVEKIILQHPAVEQVVVIGVPDPKWKEGIKAVCLLKANATLEAAEVIEFVGARIARFKKPQYVEFVAELPLNKDGSIDRGKVKSLYGQS
ncbi:AMP-binding protein [Desulfopila inferna]|uniref:AMP-binding protein n=1 Tax=Desulfopila inferna TaxID=468528 RepID=UPI001965230D|nr:AMP-binding protein [Desulfopila inferna]MBM9603751.1 AMP-binding protein [Desulfopila inferna]